MTVLRSIRPGLEILCSSLPAKVCSYEDMVECHHSILERRPPEETCGSWLQSKVLAGVPRFEGYGVW
jgi:hypothetical protein